MVRMVSCLGIALVSFACGAPSVAAASDGEPIESILVPVDGATVVSETVLVEGVTYRLRASGTAKVSNWCDRTGDAEYSHFCDPPDSVVDHCTSAPVDVGLAVDDDRVDADKHPHWGPPSADHGYTIAYLGRGAPIRLAYHDCIYWDNEGSLTVEIFAPKPVDEGRDEADPPAGESTPPTPPAPDALPTQTPVSLAMSRIGVGMPR